MLKHVEAGVLRVAYEEHGARDAAPVVLLHGFPYDVRVYDDVVPLLVRAGCRVLVPYLRGHGPTRFLSADTPRSGQQAALAHDLLALLEALSIGRPLRGHRAPPGRPAPDRRAHDHASRPG
jgi:pimeloyl-ACP methyl ester carboxylesterase